MIKHSAGPTENHAADRTDVGLSESNLVLANILDVPQSKKAG